MANHPEIRLGALDGHATVTLAAADVEATFVPGVGMLGSSLRHQGEEYLHFADGLGRYLDGHTTGIPILHPWANRLEGPHYKAAGVAVDFAKVKGWHRDANGLPIHGTLTAQPGWQVLRVAADAKAAAMVARFDFAARDDLMASFPFAHVLEVEARVEPILPAPRGRSALPRVRVVVATTIRATGRRRVPVSFGWHPYFRLPGVKRAEARLVLPARDHVALDGRGLPTGQAAREASEGEPLGKRVFDDAYRLGRDRRLAIEGGGKRLVIELDRNYPWAQVYAPQPAASAGWYVCLEPMTAPIAALANDACQFVQPGAQFTARYSITISAPTREERR